MLKTPSIPLIAYVSIVFPNPIRKFQIALILTHLDSLIFRTPFTNVMQLIQSTYEGVAGWKVLLLYRVSCLKSQSVSSEAISFKQVLSIAI